MDTIVLDTDLLVLSLLLVNIILTIIAIKVASRKPNVTTIVLKEEEKEAKKPKKKEVKEKPIEEKKETKKIINPIERQLENKQITKAYCPKHGWIIPIILPDSTVLCPVGLHQLYPKLTDREQEYKPLEFLETPQEVRQVVHNYVAPRLAKLRQQTDIDVDRYATTLSHLEEEEIERSEYVEKERGYEEGETEEEEGEK